MYFARFPQQTALTSWSS